MKYHEEFDWDPKKARTNQKAHGVSFEFAASALADELADIFHIEEYDEAHSRKENRYTTLASHPMRRSVVLKIVWTDRSTDDEQITWIISARHAARRERIIYEEKTFPKRT